MIDKKFNIVSKFSVVEKAESNSIVIEGYANTIDKDRHGDIILQEAWSKGGLDNYLKNPIILAFHDHSKPIGMMIDYFLDSKGFKIVAEISKAAGNVYDLVKEGILRSFSIGFTVKDADYDPTTDLFVIKDLELYEVSVVSVPANPNSIFSVRKSFESEEEFNKFKQEFIHMNLEEKEGKPADSEADATKSVELEKLVQALEAKISDKIEKQSADVNAALELIIESNKEKKEMTQDVTVTNNVEKLIADLESRFVEKEKSLTEALDGLRGELKEKADELAAIQRNKMTFEDRGTAVKIADSDIDAAVLVAKMLGRKPQETRFGAGLIQKAGAHVDPMTQDWEQQFSTRIENDIRQRLVVEPLIARRIAMQAPTFHFPINPEAGYGTWIASTAYRSTDGSSTGTAADHTLTDKTLIAYKLAAKEYLGYEEEEDTLLPLVAIVRDAVSRRIAKSIDKAVLRGTATAGSDPITGLVKLAADASANTTLDISNNDKFTVDAAQALRRKLGVWGLDPSELIYVVSQECYYDLLEDADFRTVDLVGANYATILKGQIGMINGSPVIVSGEFEAKADTKAGAIVLNPANFVIGTLRGVMVERDRNIEDQKNILVASTRLAFSDIISAKGVAVQKWQA
jgi:HK97 family phage prohead protease/HK97 family phage major capsid protein